MSGTSTTWLAVNLATRQLGSGPPQRRDRAFSKYRYCNFDACAAALYGRGVGATSEPSEASLAYAITEAPEPGASSEAELCKLLGPRIRLYALRHLRGEQDAADITQDTLAIVLQALRSRSVEDPSRVAHFALGTARNLVLHVLRRQRVRAAMESSHVTEVVGCIQPEISTIDLERLFHCFSGLPERDRAVLDMTFYEDRSSAEICAAMGLSLANVRVIRHRALLKLRACIDGRDGVGA